MPRLKEHIILLIQSIVILPSRLHFHLAPIKGMNKLPSSHNVPANKLKQYIAPEQGHALKSM